MFCAGYCMKNIYLSHLLIAAAVIQALSSSHSVKETHLPNHVARLSFPAALLRYEVHAMGMASCLTNEEVSWRSRCPLPPHRSPKHPCVSSDLDAYPSPATACDFRLPPNPALAPALAQLQFCAESAEVTIVPNFSTPILQLVNVSPPLSLQSVPTASR